MARTCMIRRGTFNCCVWTVSRACRSAVDGGYLQLGGAICESGRPEVVIGVLGQDGGAGTVVVVVVIQRTGRERTGFGYVSHAGCGAASPTIARASSVGTFTPVVGCVEQSVLKAACYVALQNEKLSWEIGNETGMSKVGAISKAQKAQI